MPWECFDIVPMRHLSLVNPLYAISQSFMDSLLPSGNKGWFFFSFPAKCLVLTLSIMPILTVCCTMKMGWARHPLPSHLWYSSRGYLMVSQLLHQHFIQCANTSFHLVCPWNANNPWQTGWDYTICLYWEGCLPKIIDLIALAGPVRV